MLMPRPAISLVVLLWGLAFLATLGMPWLGGKLASAREPAASPVEELAGMLIQRCVVCHGPDKQEGGYRLDTFGQLLVAGDSNKLPVVPKQPQASELLRRLITSDATERMPAESEPLPAAEVAVVERWIASGAEIDPKLQAVALSSLAKSMRKHQTPEHYPSALPITAITFGSAISENPGNSKDSAASPASVGSDRLPSVWTSGYGEIIHWQLQPTPKLIERLAVAGVQVTDIELSRDGRLMAVASGIPATQGQTQVFRRAAQAWQLVWSADSADVPGDMAFSPEGRRLAIGLSDGTLMLADLGRLIDSASDTTDTAVTNAEITTQLFAPHADAILDLAWSPSGDRLITGSRDRTAKIFKAEGIELIANYDRHERAVGGVAYCGNNPVSFDETGKLRLWSGDDNDRTLAERDNLARFLEPLTSQGERIWLAEGSELRSFTVERKTVHDGQDDAGKTKSKSTTGWSEGLRRVSGHQAWLLSTAAMGDWTVAGNEAGEVILWTKEQTEPTLSFSARP
ncbi:MAG: hypothetical protein IT423_14260 [Pirellulaceae bacterium]|nr:hypothetical protein [Pirellulaceae bacterium]